MKAKGKPANLDQLEPKHLTLIDKYPSLILVIRAADVVERSWSIGADGAVEQRFLVFLGDVDDRANDLARAASALGAPKSLISAWQNRIGGADALGLAVNTQLTSVRLYAQYWDMLVRRVQRDVLGPFPLYLGCKALPDGSLREDVYLCHPLAPKSQFMPPITTAMQGLGVPSDQIAKVFSALTEDSCIFTETENAARRSWLATVRRAAPDTKALAAALAIGFGPRPAPWQRAVLVQAEAAPLLHIAGGQDSTKGSFTTLYFESTPAQMLAALGQTTDL